MLSIGNCNGPVLSSRGRLRRVPLVTCPERALSSSQSSSLVERTRKCPGAGLGFSGRAVRAFVPEKGSAEINTAL